MTTYQSNRSHLVKMKVCNFGCIGPDGVEIALDDIVCLVGQNNCGKSTVLRAYEAAVTGVELKADDIHANAGGKPATVELWVHIPEGAGNIDEKWKTPVDGMLLVRAKWEWPLEGGKPVRMNWERGAPDYAVDEKASGLDSVFYSRLPRPFRIGSLDDPAEEHKKLLEILLEPIKTKLVALMKDEGSELRASIKALQTEAEKPVAEFQGDLEKVQAQVNDSYRRVFSAAQIRVSVSLGELTVDPGAALAKSSHVGVVESHGQTRWSQQGTGSQRALFWSMLEVRSKLNILADERKAIAKQAIECEKKLKALKEKAPTLKQAAAKEKREEEIKRLEAELAVLRPTDSATELAAPAPFLPGYMLLIDEPETALHPAAIRAAKEYLYSLAGEAGWQIMLSTHHPAFVDPLKDHTTIVRLHRSDTKAAPNVYRADTMRFSPDDPTNEAVAKETLKTLLAFDQSVAEMFFAQKVIIVEGDTEFAAFTVAMDADMPAFPLDGRPLLLRARGKWTIPILVRMLAHFKVSCAVLHDVDSPRSSSGATKNGAYTANDAITKAIETSRTADVHMIHRCSAPDFERKHGMKLPSKDKPFEAWNATRKDAAVLASVRKVLDELCAIPAVDAAAHADDGQHYATELRVWADTNAKDDPAFTLN